MQVENLTEKLLFTNGQFTPNEISDILCGMLGGAINSCSIRQWGEWEKNHFADLSHYNAMITDLNAKRNKLKEYIKKINAQGEVKIELVLSLQVG